MADGGSNDKVAFCTQIRQDIGARQKRAFALPNQVEVEMSRRLLALNRKINELQEFAPEKAQVVRSRYVIIERSITGGNAQTADGPLTQLDGFVEQLLKQDRPVQNNTNDPARQPRPGRYIPPRQEPQEPVQNPQQRVPNNTNDQARGNPQQFEQPVQNTGQPVQNPQRRVPNNTNDPARGNPQQLGQPVQNTGQPVQNSPAKNPMLKDPLSKAPLRSAPPTRTPLPRQKAVIQNPQAPQQGNQILQQEFSAAAAQVQLLANRPPDPTVENKIAHQTAQLTAMYTQEMRGLIESARQDQDEDIHRKVFLVFDSKDKQYLDNVQKPCDEALITIGAALAQNTAATPDMTKKLELLIPQLNQWRVHYADKSGINPKETELLKQRDAKVAAIEKREKSIQAILTNAAKIASARTELERTARAGRKIALENDGTLDSVKKLAANIAHASDQITAKAALKDLAKFMGKIDAVSRQVLLAELPDPKFAIPLVDAAEQADSDRILVDLIKLDRNAVAGLTEEAVVGDIGRVEHRETMLRENTAGPKFAQALGSTGPGKAFVDAAVQGSLDAVKNYQGDLDVKQTIRPPMGERNLNQNPEGWAEYDRQVEEFERQHAKQINAHKMLARESVDRITTTPVPPELAEVCGTMYAEALKRYKQLNPPDGGATDEEDALTIVGGHLMLRLINPPMAKGSGDLALTPEKRAAFTHQSKLLQHISNGSLPSGRGASAQFDELVGTPDRPSPEILQLQAFFKDTAMKGRRVKANKLVTLDRVLNNPQALALLKQFMQARQCEEVVEFWELAHAGVPANPQQVYDTYINGRKMINIDNKHDFDTVNSQNPKNWANAPWGSAVAAMRNLMTQDTMQKLILDPMWDRVYPLFGI